MDSAKDTNDSAFTIDEFCVWAKIGRTSVFEDLKNGQLRAKKRGQRTIIPRQSALDWLANLPDRTPASIPA
jgi:hypothetical protein